MNRSRHGRAAMPFKKRKSRVVGATEAEIRSDFAAMGIIFKEVSVNTPVRDRQPRRENKAAGEEIKTEVSAADSDDDAQDHEYSSDLEADTDLDPEINAGEGRIACTRSGHPYIDLRDDDGGNNTDLDLEVNAGEGRIAYTRLRHPYIDRTDEDEDNEGENGQEIGSMTDNDEIMEETGSEAEEPAHTTLTIPDVALMAKAYRYTDYSLRQRKK
ncbi:hypothetical protein BU16DRAFT_604124 [Lophium mytilinum]|uniref:Uncharacterized protein n=1 Tax=Lophium mytilinum TaxID=390894 RepID=A0A6A6R5P7_9PEZI|nr:hypothetical protein BU16DRAFT_604124 [Lophium mytilinum]